MLDKSSTYDAQVYVLAGYGYLETGEYCLKQDAPPMIPLLSAVAVQALAGKEVELPESISERFHSIKKLWSERDFDSTQEYGLATEFFRINDAGRTIGLIQLARIPMVLIGCLLGVYLYRFAELLYGAIPGLIALSLYCFDPNMVGHARVVAADLPLACFMLMAHYYFYRSVTEKEFANVIGLAICSALCVGVKLSGILLFPSLVILTISLFVNLPTKTKSLFETAPQSRSWLIGRAFTGASLVFLFSIGMLCLLYGSFSGPLQYFSATKLIYSNVPEAYQSYLFGRFQPQFWYYYPAAILVKSPEWTLGLAVAGTLFFLRSSQFDKRWLIVPGMLLFLVCSFDQINIGLRRVLAIFPFLFLTIARVIAVWFSTERKSLKGMAVVAVVLCVAVSVSQAFWTFPNHLTYFNLAAGGPSSGHKILTESNVSWGQNLPALKRYLDSRQISSARMSFYGNESRSSYGLNDKGFSDFEVYWPIQDIYVMSAHSLIVHSMNRDQGSDWFTRFEPDAVICNSLYVYDLRNYPKEVRTAEASLELARKQVSRGKHSSSIINFQAYLKANPQDSVVHLELSAAAQSFGHSTMAEFHKQQARDHLQGNGWFYDSDE